MTDRPGLIDRASLRTNVLAGVIVLAVGAIATALWRPAWRIVQHVLTWMTQLFAMPRWAAVVGACAGVYWLVVALRRKARQNAVDSAASGQQRRFPPMPILQEPITELQWRILLALAQRFEPLRAEAIAKAIDANPHRVADAAGDLGRRGLVNTATSRQSGSQYQLAASGRDLLLKTGAI